jgi:hypothetical protein
MAFIAYFPPLGGFISNNNYNMERMTTYDCEKTGQRPILFLLLRGYHSFHKEILNAV